MTNTKWKWAGHVACMKDNRLTVSGQNVVKFGHILSDQRTEIENRIIQQQIIVSVSCLVYFQATFS